MIVIQPYEKHHAKAFESINLSWLEGYIGVTDKDCEILANPERMILDQGGIILIAIEDGKAIGTICLEKHADKTLITKLGVAKDQRGKGIGMKLCLAVIDEAREMGLNELWLETSQKLQPAIKLYKKLGFEDMNSASRSPLCDLVMRKKL